jgi:hypothetical protein
MKTVFTFPKKNPKYYNIKELKKTCQYLNLDYNKLNKQELIILVTDHYHLLPNRVQIQYNNIFYYINNYSRLKSFIKIKEDEYHIRYDVRFHKSKTNYQCFYNKYTNKWELQIMFKTKMCDIDLFIKGSDLHHLRKGYLFIEYLDIYLKYKLLLQNGLIIKDILTNMTHILYNISKHTL